MSATVTLDSLRGKAEPPTKPAAQGMSLAQINALPRHRQFPAMLDAFKHELKVALPAHLNPDRMVRIALTCFRQNPTLAECEPASVFAAVVMASQLGLEPGLMGQAYLIPYNKKVKRKNEQGREVELWVKECQLIPGYQGLVDLARRSGRIKSLEAHVVYSNDKFVCRFGMTPDLVHEPHWDGDRGEMRLAYAVAHLADGGTHVEVMTRSQIHAIRDRSQNVQNAKKWNKTTPWDTDEEQMWIKTILRRISKFLPKSVELASALALDAAAARGAQNMDLSSVIEGDYETVASLAHSDDEDTAPETAGENDPPQGPDPAGDDTPPPQSSSAGPSPTSESTTTPRPARRSRTLE